MFDRHKELKRTGALSSAEWELTQSALEILKAQIDAKRDALLDARELIEAQLEAKRAEIAGAEAQMELEAVKLGTLEKIGARQPGMVASGEIKQAALAVKTKEADLNAKRAELKEIEVRLKQIDRQLVLIGQIRPDPKDLGPPAATSTERSVPPPR
jgi:multidrug efflux pump subunit AcrA (membrane-fusion protein)